MCQFGTSVSFGKLTNVFRVDYNRNRISTQNLYSLSPTASSGNLKYAGLVTIRLTEVAELVVYQLRRHPDAETRCYAATRPFLSPTRSSGIMAITLGAGEAISAAFN